MFIYKLFHALVSIHVFNIGKAYFHIKNEFKGEYVLSPDPSGPYFVPLVQSVPHFGNSFLTLEFFPSSVFFWAKDEGEKSTQRKHGSWLGTRVLFRRQ